MDKVFDFSGWATKINVKCSDGRTILKDAFKHQDGEWVSMVWNHQHNDPENILGRALLEHREEGIYAYGQFNDTPKAQLAKAAVEHGDVVGLSICANQLRQTATGGVMHGMIRELSLVVAGANPGAFIDTVIKHGDGMNEERTVFGYVEEQPLYHWDEFEDEDDIEEEVTEEELAHAEDNKEEEPMDNNEGKTIQEIVDTMNEEQQEAYYYSIAKALEHSDDLDDEPEIEEGDETPEEDDEEPEEGEETSEENEEELNHSEGGSLNMKENVFDKTGNVQNGRMLTHADKANIIELAKDSSCGSLQKAMREYCTDNGFLKHSEDNVGVFENYGVLFPELELLKKGEPETIYAYNNSWVGPALKKIHKSPFSRIRTRFADARLAELNAMRAKGYKSKGEEKKAMGQISTIKRETTPQTIYIKDSLHRDDIIDVTDFDIVSYEWKQMRYFMDETLILAAMVGDGRDVEDPDKIKEDHIRPIWTDNEEYTIHCDVDIAKAKEELQGTETGAHFGDNYIYAEAIITAALYSREKFKGTGTPDFYCTPHLVNVMLLARDLNGRRIYDSKSDLAKSLNCASIVEVEHFEGLTREDEDGNIKKLLGLFVNLNDYTFGASKGGELSKFEDFDIDFNMHTFLLETRLSGSLYKLKSAIALEEPVEEEIAG